MSKDFKITPLWPGGLQRAVTFSYDDGRIFDRRLVEILNRHGLKGTFNLNSGLLGSEGKYVEASEIRDLYAGHEVAVHTVTHPFPRSLHYENLLWEFVEDRRRLENLMGCVIKGCAYPFTDFNDRVVEVLRVAGIEYARTAFSHGGFHVPDDWLRWHPTCHDKAVDENLLNKFFSSRWAQRDRLLYIWGHSYEFEEQGRWESIEKICNWIGNRAGEFWAATNGEIYSYCKAWEGLRFTVDCKRVENPSALAVWLKWNDGIFCVNPAESVFFS